MDEPGMRRAIARKRDGGTLGADEWAAVVAGFLAGTIDDAQTAALAMACVWRGLAFEETLALTRALTASGETLEWGSPGPVDKHSTGGVADTVTPIVVPLVAACGVPVAKLSGRALGHTGGTLDKLEALAGVRTDLSPAAFRAQVERVGCAIAAQSERLVPGDKKLYALRDRTATIPDPGLIAASIVSKKIAGGAAAIVYDVKTGRGAFMRDAAEANGLARLLTALTRELGRPSRALVTDMDEPLGSFIGTGLELLEARDFLNGTRRSQRLGGVCEAVASALLSSAGIERPAERIAQALANGAAYECFERMLAAQGARSGALEALAPASARHRIVAQRGGFVREIDAVALGECARELTESGGANAGIAVAAPCGSRIAAGDVLAFAYGPAGERLAARILAAFSFGEEPAAPRPLVAAEFAAA
jgi:pyrimidine-nucleoside phosphorylase